jgi:hypothetical protein
LTAWRCPIRLIVSADWSRLLKQRNTVQARDVRNGTDLWLQFANTHADSANSIVLLSIPWTRPLLTHNHWNRVSAQRLRCVWGMCVNHSMNHTVPCPVILSQPRFPRFLIVFQRFGTISDRYQCEKPNYGLPRRKKWNGWKLDADISCGTVNSDHCNW